jgi:hypothetical protein
MAAINLNGKVSQYIVPSDVHYLAYSSSRIATAGRHYLCRCIPPK